jgi:hypothetical protein
MHIHTWQVVIVAWVLIVAFILRWFHVAVRPPQ